uniref:Prostaglandin reductase 1 n=1 Tax=Geodia cydonium TaxID=6047 RepID=Q967C7_GEOCY|nr:leukotriene B4 [Geodia cydonium]
MATKIRKYVLRSHFSGFPQRDALEIVEEELPPIKDGEFLCEAQWISVDPYMRPYTSRLPLGITMIGTQVAKVVESKNDKYSPGDLVSSNFGWVTHTISDGVQQWGGKQGPVLKLDPAIHSSPSTALGVLGMPGATSYFGFLEICQPKKGETLVVNGGAGAVGSLVGQIAKLKGCRVVGFAGSDAKVKYMLDLGFDAAYNYKTVESLDAAIKESCPNGVDLFFDNVGGEFFEVTLSNMNEFGRVSVCGAISLYNATEKPKFRSVSEIILFKQLKVEGFIVARWLDQWPKAFKEISEWIKEGKVKYDEHVTEGFDNMFDAFAGLFTGDNTGKAIVKI